MERLTPKVRPPAGWVNGCRHGLSFHDEMLIHGYGIQGYHGSECRCTDPEHLTEIPTSWYRKLAGDNHNSDALRQAAGFEYQDRILAVERM